MAGTTDERPACQVVDLAVLPTLLHSTSRVIHFKGFGPRMDVVAQRATMEAVCSDLLEADIVQFDGDDLDQPHSLCSFTSCFHTLLPMCEARGRPYPTLLAFKLEAEVDRFLDSWSHFVRTHALTLYVLPVPEALCHEASLRAPPAGLTEEDWRGKGCTRAYPTDTLLAAQEKYVALGAFAIDAVQGALSSSSSSSPSRQQRVVAVVVVWGGYQVLRRELAVHIARYAGRALPWQYYHAWRIGRDGERQEGQLLACEGVHPCLTVQSRLL